MTPDETDLAPGPDGARPVQEQILLLGLPNTGTDWVAELLLRQNPELRYYREFFNPICNPRYEDVLNRAFGCEMVDSYRRIARPDGPCEEVYRQTWAREGYNFTKENYLAFKVGAFADRFRCFVLHRRAEDSLPGGRLQVKAWFDAMYWSLEANKAALPADVRLLVGLAGVEADSINRRVVAAYVIYYHQLLKEARRHGLPVVEYDTLMRASRDELVPYLRGLPGVIDPGRMADDVCATRRPAPRDFGSLEAGGLYRRLLDLSERLGATAAQPRNCCITSAAFCPPKPKLVETAVRTGTSRALLGT